MVVKLIVRSDFGKRKRNSNSLSESEKDRLTSRTKDIEENIIVEFEIEKGIRKIGEFLGIIFVESNNNSILDGNYDLRKKELSWEEQKEMITALRLPIPEVKEVSDITNKDIFPCIIKNPESRKGREVYLVKNFDFFKKFEMFLNSSRVVVPSLGGVINYDSTIEREKFICQQYVSTPGRHFTSYRILVSCVGNIISSALVYSGNTKDSGELLKLKDKNKLSKNTDTLITPDSPFYLESLKVTSNVSQGGGFIILEPTEKSKKPEKYEKEILKQNRLNPDNPSIPEQIKEKSKLIGRYLGENVKGLFFGIDWIQSNEGQYYYLETNLNPAGKIYVNSHMYGVGTHEEAYILMISKILKDIKDIFQ